MPARERGLVIEKTGRKVTANFGKRNKPISGQSQFNYSQKVANQSDTHFLKFFSTLLA
ncbi:MAG: hypothetical protein KIS77_19975 [Saprospiraceae bacterium]|nr:hypothetical protein [Saprospiraceae bacterium]